MKSKSPKLLLIALASALGIATMIANPRPRSTANRRTMRGCRRRPAMGSGKIRIFRITAMRRMTSATIGEAGLINVSA